MKLLFLIVFLSNLKLYTQCEENYRFVYMYNLDINEYQVLNLNLLSEEDAIVKIELKGINEEIYLKKYEFVNRQYKTNNYNNFNYINNLNNIITDSTKISRNNLIIKSNQKLNPIIFFNCGETCTDATTLVEPYLGTAFNLNYFSTTQNNKRKFSIISSKSNNDIFIYNKTSNKIDTVYLNEFESVTFIVNSSDDLSNIKITSKYPVNIFIQHSKMYIPNNSEKHLNDATLSVIYPNNILGNEYILTPISLNSDLLDALYYFKIVALEDETNIIINGKFITTLQSTEFLELNSRYINYITSSKKISVTQFSSNSESSSNQYSQPSMTHVLPTSIKQKYIKFFASNNNNSDDIYLNIVANIDDNVYLNNNKIENFERIYNSSFKFRRIILQKGNNLLTSSNGVQGVIYSHNGLYSSIYNLNNDFQSTLTLLRINGKYFNDTLCFNSPFILSADAPEEAVTFDWTINDTLKVSGKEVNLDLPKDGTYKIKLKIDNDDSQVYEWTTTRLEKIKSDLDSVIYLCNDSLSNILMNVSGGGTSKSITWFPSENIKDPTQFNIEFIKPLKDSTKLFYEVNDEHCCTYLDSVDIQITNVNPIITASQNNFCYGDSTTLSLDKDYESIIWNTGESTKDIVVKESGVYSATVTQGECTNDTNIVINVNPLPTLDIEAPNGTILCDGGSIILEAKVLANTSIVWNDGTRLAKRTFSKSGTYTLTAEDLTTGCKNTKSIIVSDIEILKAEIQGDPAFCDGESTTLTIQPQGKSYLWNTGETTQSIVVNQSGVYSATITTDTDCKIDAEIEVIKNPLPTFQILGEIIICNNSTTIYPDKDFKFYEWSNGETSKSITINKAGIYELTVTDKNGCKAKQNIAITESTPEINLSNRNIDFGELLFGDTKLENITSDKDIIFIKNSSVFDIDYNNKNIDISFNPIDIGQFIDTLIIESIGDCKALDTIYIKGICKAKILAKVSNSKGYPGDLVNNTVNLELLQDIPLPKDFNYEINIQINQDAIQIQDATTFNYKNNKLEINIADYINKTQYDEKIKDINSKIMLAKNLENELIITKFETDNPYLIPIRQNGNIKIYEVCLYEERLIEAYNEALIKQITQTKITLTTYYAGKYEIEIADINGKTTTKEVTTKSDNEEINFNYKLSNGTYIIKINEPGKTQTRKIVFVE